MLSRRVTIPATELQLTHRGRIERIPVEPFAIADRLKLLAMLRSGCEMYIMETLIATDEPAAPKKRRPPKKVKPVARGKAKGKAVRGKPRKPDVADLLAVEAIDHILAHVHEQPNSTAEQIKAGLGVKGDLGPHLKRLVKSGAIVSTGKARGTRYALPSVAKKGNGSPEATATP